MWESLPRHMSWKGLWIRENLRLVASSGTQRVILYEIFLIKLKTIIKIPVPVPPQPCKWMSLGKCTWNLTLHTATGSITSLRCPAWPNQMGLSPQGPGCRKTKMKVSAIGKWLRLSILCVCILSTCIDVHRFAYVLFARCNFIKHYTVLYIYYISYIHYLYYI